MARHASATSASTSTTSSGWMVLPSCSSGTRARISGTFLASLLLPGRQLLFLNSPKLVPCLLGTEAGDLAPGRGPEESGLRPTDRFLVGTSARHLLHLSQGERKTSSLSGFALLLRRGLELGTRNWLAFLGAYGFP